MSFSNGKIVIVPLDSKDHFYIGFIIQGEMEYSAVLKEIQYI